MENTSTTIVNPMAEQVQREGNKTYLRKSLELHGTSPELIEYCLQYTEEAETVEQMALNSQPALTQAFPDEVHRQSLISTVMQLAQSAESFEKIYPNVLSPTIRKEEPKKSTTTKKSSGGTKRAPQPTIELPVAIDFLANGSVPVADFIKKSQELEAQGISPCYPNWEEHCGWKSGVVNNVIKNCSGLTASQFVKNRVWAEGNHTSANS